MSARESPAVQDWTPVTVGLVLLASAMLASAWLCDDAYITFRTVENFSNGEGLRWNVAERVQSYTHPLWMFAISALYSLSGDIYYSAIGLSFACTLAAVAIVTRRVALSARLALLALVPLILSKAFIDYTSSGLENPLSYLLLALFFWCCAEPQPGKRRTPRTALRLGLVAGLLGLNRLDALLLVLPYLLLFLAQHERWRSRSVMGALALGLLPLAGWEIFSLLYYGFPFPNTAYAKLSTGIAKSALVAQGLRYFADSLLRDPVTLLSMAAGIAVAFTGPPAMRARRIAIAAGMVLYLLYVVWIGGDFMSGRLFAAPLLCATILLSEARALTRRTSVAMGIALIVLALIAGVPTLTSGPEYGSDENHATRQVEHGVGDERAFYYPHTGLLRRWLGLARVEDHIWAVRGQAARNAGITWAQGQAMGFYGFYAGPRVHILDMVGLSDPLLARIDARPTWRIGHFERKVPRGYVDTLRSQTNQIADRDLASYYDTVLRIVRDPVFDAERLAAIARINLGVLDPLLDGYRSRNPAGRK